MKKILTLYPFHICAMILFALSTFFGYSEYVRDGTIMQITKWTIIGFACGMVIVIGIFCLVCLKQFLDGRKPKV